MKELEKIVGGRRGGGLGHEDLSRLGKELEKEVQRLQSAQDPRLAEVLKSFETFLEDMFNRKEGHDFNTLSGLPKRIGRWATGSKRGTPQSRSYFGKGAAALQLLLDMDGSTRHDSRRAATGVKLKLVTCKRRQKSFAEAHQMIVEILKKKNRALDAQEEAARLFQDWASRGDDLDNGSRDQRSRGRKGKDQRR